jgi:hypothetical protein
MKNLFKGSVLKSTALLVPVFSTMLLSAPVFADDISLGTPGYGGSGCPVGSVSVTLSPDAKSLSLLFDQYQVAVGGTTGKSFDRKSCNIAIPVHVPQGLSVSVLKIDFRGFNHLPVSATSQALRGRYLKRNFAVPSMKTI